MDGRGKKNKASHMAHSSLTVLLFSQNGKVHGSIHQAGTTCPWVLARSAVASGAAWPFNGGDTAGTGRSIGASRREVARGLGFFFKGSEKFVGGSDDALR